MADQGRWFKLWVSAPDDDGLAVLQNADFACWAKLGVYLKEHGTDGTVSLTRPLGAWPHPLQARFQVGTFEDMVTVLRRLPGIDVEERRDETGALVSCSVGMRNWRRYQEDYSTERVRAYRAKNRGGAADLKRPPETDANVTCPVSGETLDETSKKRREEKRREEILFSACGGRARWLRPLQGGLPA